MTGRTAVALALASGGLACAESTPPPPSASVRTDSAGIQVVEHRGRPAQRWTLAPPLLSIGVIGGDPDQELSGVAAAVRTPSNGIVLSDRGSRDLRVFDDAGRFERRLGGPGEGPGEFGAPADVALFSDTVRVWDGRRLRVSDFDVRSGDYLGGYTVRTALANPRLVAFLADGGVVLRDDRLEIPESGIELLMSEYLWVGPDGEIADTLPTQPWTRMGVLDLGVGQTIGGPVFEPSTASSGDRGGYWIGTGQSPELLRFGANGSLQMIVRWESESRPVRGAHRDAFLATATAGLPETQAAIRREILEARGFADLFPPFDRIVADGDGGVWFREVTAPGDGGPTRWRVIDRAGEIVAEVQVPPDLRVLAVSHEAVVVLLTDPLGVEQVQLLPLSQPPLPHNGEST